MALARITPAIRDSFGTGTGPTKDAYFNKEDIEHVLGQPGVKALKYDIGIVNNLDCGILIAVAQYDPNSGATSLLDADNDLIVVSCPPFADIGWI